MLKKLYQIVIHYAKHRHARWVLAGVSFAESSVFPVPPDALLVPMGLAKPKQAFQFALIATISSVLGACVGYAMGYAFLQVVYPWIVKLGYAPAYQTVQHWFSQWGFWAVLLAAFTPIPYKIFTIAAGSVRMAIVPFFLASIVGRALRYFLVSALLYWHGERAHQWLETHASQWKWASAAVLLFVMLAWYVIH